MRKICSLATLLLAAALCSHSFAQNNLKVSPWRMYQDKVIPVKGYDGKNSEIAYAAMTIPASNATGWKAAAYGADGEVSFSTKSIVPECLKFIQPTYFETVVNIPRGTKVNKFSVSYIKADDGARIYIFNSKNPKGAFDVNADLKRGQTNSGAIDLSRFVTEGDNRVVIAQYDDCPVLNNVHGINISVNGEEVTPKVLPAKFRLHAYSINGQRVAKGSDYWMGFNGNDKTGRILGAKNGSVMMMEKVENPAAGTIAFKVVNSAGMYLTVNDDMSVKLAPLDPKSNKHLFMVRQPEENSAANLNYVSFESANKPGAYLRHEGFVLKVHKPTDAERKNNIVYRQDASWLFEQTN